MKGKVGYTLFGGLGNRLFQAAAIKAYSWDNDKECILFYVCNNPHASNDVAMASIFRKIAPDMNIMAAPYFMDNRQYLMGIGLTSDEIDKIWLDPEYNPPIHGHPNFEGDDHKKFYKLPVIDDNLFLPGYFGNKQFFDHHRERIIDLFAPTDEITEYLHLKYPRFSDSVALHIRMPDHVPRFELPANWERFYVDAVHEVAEKYGPDIHFYIFCNRTITTEIGFIKDASYDLIVEDDVRTLYAMSFCRLGCISRNSTVSWWGDYLNTNPDKLSIIAW
jgi:hypothetical protein